MNHENPTELPFRAGDKESNRQREIITQQAKGGNNNSQRLSDFLSNSTNNDLNMKIII
jgi:hypothetical protein